MYLNIQCNITLQKHGHYLEDFMNWVNKVFLNSL